MGEREPATILAALRFWQANGDDEDAEFSEHFTVHKRLTEEEIDDLCETLNTDGIRVVCFVSGGVVQGCRANFPVDFDVYDSDNEASIPPMDYAGISEFEYDRLPFRVF